MLAKHVDQNKNGRPLQQGGDDCVTQGPVTCHGTGFNKRTEFIATGISISAGLMTSILFINAAGEDDSKI